VRRMTALVIALAVGVVAAVAGLRRVDRRRGAMSRREHIALLIHREADHRLSPLGVWVMRRTRGRLANLYHVQALVLTTTGRRSGQRRSVVLQSFPDGDDYVVVATNDGADRPPAWFLNLQADPAVEVEVRGRRTPARAVTLPPKDAAAWWPRILELAPDYERYARATDRAFPVVRLRPAGAAAPAPAPAPKP
jgi:deazaflavin-dependent oxidoreductase (nitroreductase family)